MPASYYRAESEDGDGIDDPSEDALFMMIDDLNQTDNTFVVIQPDTEDPAWFTSVAVLEEGGYEVEWRDMRRHDHELTVHQDTGQIAKDLTIWMAGRTRG